MSEANETAGIACGSSPLLSSDLRVGHCVIVNEVEQPCGHLVAVIVAVEGKMIRAKYLSDDPQLNSYNKRGILNHIDTATPCGHFGVQVRVGDDGCYWCEPVAESRATYADGKPRPWQERGFVVKYTARPDVLAVARDG